MEQQMDNDCFFGCCFFFPAFTRLAGNCRGVCQACLGRCFFGICWEVQCQLSWVHNINLPGPHPTFFESDAIMAIIFRPCDVPGPGPRP